MLDWLRRALDIRVENTCNVCDELREQLQYERTQNKELIETITSLVKPAPVVMSSGTANVPQAIPRGGMFTRRRSIMEAADRIAAGRLKTSPVAAKPDTELTKQIEKLERELELPTEKTNEHSEHSDLHGKDGTGEHVNGSSIPERQGS